MDMTLNGALNYVNIFKINIRASKAKGRRNRVLSAGMKDMWMDGGRPGTSINPRHSTLICNLIPVVYMALSICIKNTAVMMTNPYHFRDQGDMCYELPRGWLHISKPGTKEIGVNQLDKVTSF
jgi:hypothetical protein